MMPRRVTSQSAANVVLRPLPLQQHFEYRTSDRVVNFSAIYARRAFLGILPIIAVVLGYGEVVMSQARAA